MPRGKPFQPGQSGNPNGRKPLPLDIVELCREFTKKGVEKLIAIAEMDASDPAILGVQVRAVDSILNRGWGTAPQTVIMQGDTTIRIVTPLTKK